MKDILNRVVEAERAAQANLIKCREEAAATRLHKAAGTSTDIPHLLLQVAERHTSLYKYRMADKACRWVDGGTATCMRNRSGVIYRLWLILQNRVSENTLAVMNAPETLFAKLQAMGAGEFVHLNGSLASHLRGTEALLRSWGASEVVCVAGLYHAVYGTDGYNPSLAGLNSRPQISNLIGTEAEELAYLFGACNRAVFYPRIGGESPLWFADRFQSSEYAISLEQLKNLCELILANELEIASNSAEFRATYGPRLSPLFERMRGLVSEAGFTSFRRVLGNAG